jgi:tetratricopeptide (TPR) repeat protein
MSGSRHGNSTTSGSAFGNYEGAEDAFRRGQEYGISPEPGMSLLRLARGDPTAAKQGLQTALDALSDDRLARLRLLPAAVQAAVATQDLATARTAVTELEESAEMHDKPAITATAEHARGTLELADGNTGEAARGLQSALRLWQRLDAPYDAALARTLLAEAHLARGDRDSGLLELEAAGTSFERLGARIDLERVTERITAVNT